MNKDRYDETRLVIHELYESGEIDKDSHDKLLICAENEYYETASEMDITFADLNEAIEEGVITVDDAVDLILEAEGEEEEYYDGSGGKGWKFALALGLGAAAIAGGIAAFRKIQEIKGFNNDPALKACYNGVLKARRKIKELDEKIAKLEAGIKGNKEKSITLAKKYDRRDGSVNQTVNKSNDGNTITNTIKVGTPNHVDKAKFYRQVASDSYDAEHQLEKFKDARKDLMEDLKAKVAELKLTARRSKTIEASDKTRICEQADKLVSVANKAEKNIDASLARAKKQRFNLNLQDSD